MVSSEKQLNTQAMLDGLGQGVLIFDSADHLVLDNLAARTILGSDLKLIRAEGWKALTERLGISGAIRFLMEYDPGRGDYVEERRELFRDLTLEDAIALARAYPDAVIEAFDTDDRSIARARRQIQPAREIRGNRLDRHPETRLGWSIRLAATRNRAVCIDALVGDRQFFNRHVERLHLLVPNDLHRHRRGYQCRPQRSNLQPEPELQRPRHADDHDERRHPEGTDQPPQGGRNLGLGEREQQAEPHQRDQRGQVPEEQCHRDAVGADHRSPGPR